jgi:hypothetical protein
MKTTKKTIPQASRDTIRLSGDAYDMRHTVELLDYQDACIEQFAELFLSLQDIGCQLNHVGIQKVWEHIQYTTAQSEPIGITVPDEWFS